MKKLGRIKSPEVITYLENAYKKEKYKYGYSICCFKSVNLSKKAKKHIRKYKNY